MAGEDRPPSQSESLQCSHDGNDSRPQDHDKHAREDKDHGREQDQRACFMSPFFRLLPAPPSEINSMRLQRFGNTGPIPL